MSKVNINQLEKIDIQPFRENRASSLQRRIGGMWSCNCNLERHWFSKDKNPYRQADLIIKNNIGKSLDLTYKYYLKKVKYYDKHKVFCNELYSRWYYKNNYGYYVDDNGLIQERVKIKTKKPNIILSWDFKQEWRSNGLSAYSKNYNRYDKLVIIQGQKFEFQSKDYKYYREYYHQEFLKRKAKKLRKTPKLSMDEFRKILKEKELKEKQLNLIKIESHGFDINTSFKK